MIWEVLHGSVMIELRTSRCNIAVRPLYTLKRGSEMTRRLSGMVIIDGTDDEFWPFGDEKVHRETNVQMILDVGQPAAVIEVPDVRWGGECRVQVQLTARALEDNVVQIQGNAKLFEGTAEDTRDLADEKVVTFTVPTGGIPAHHRVQLRNNEDLFGGDHSEIGLSLTNSIVE
jgi:hypothetical protein